MKDLNAVLPASGKNGDDTGWVRFKLPIASDPGQIQGAVDNRTTSRFDDADVEKVKSRTDV